MHNTIVSKSDFPVDLVLQAGSDEFICQAARVSTLGAASYGTGESEGLLNFLLSNRHGSPFEHGLMTFRITAPILVWREFMRHRIGFSYNEQSGRYMVLEPYFYVPPRDRPLVQVGKAGAYEMVPGTDEQYELVVEKFTKAYGTSWESYSDMLKSDIAKELARAPIPVGIYSSAYVTCNPRSMMSFLSLRTKEEWSKFPSFPQWEIEQVARRMELAFEEHWPTTYRVFNDNGRLSP